MCVIVKWVTLLLVNCPQESACRLKTAEISICENRKNHSEDELMVNRWNKRRSSNVQFNAL